MPILGTPGQGRVPTTQGRNSVGSVGGTGAVDPMTDFYSKMMSSGNPSEEMFGYLIAQYLQGSAQAGLGGTMAQAQMAMTGPQLGVAQTEMATNTGYDLANMLLGRQSLGLQQSQLGTEQAASAAQQGIERQQYGLGQQAFGVQQTQYPEQYAEAALANKNAVQQLQQQGAIGGTLLTEGSKQRFATQAAQYGWQNADIYRNQLLSQLSNRQTQLGQASEEVGYGAQQAGYATQAKQLALQAKGQGLAADQAMSQLGFGLQQLGYQGDPTQFLSQIAQAQGSQAQQYAGIASQAGLLGGMGPIRLGG